MSFQTAAVYRFVLWIPSNVPIFLVSLIKLPIGIIFDQELKAQFLKVLKNEILPARIQIRGTASTPALPKGR